MGRSGVTAKISSFVGLDRAAGAKFDVRTYFDFKSSWEDLANEQEFTNRRQKIGASISKLAGLHIGQVIFVAAGFWAYQHSMGWVQYVLAWMVNIKEGWYLYLIVLALKRSVLNFTMFCPFTEQNRMLVFAYLLDPDYFIACCLSGEDDLKRSTSLRKATYWISFIGGVAALLAVFVGLGLPVQGSQAVIFPGLLLGYAMSGCSVGVIPISALYTALDGRTGKAPTQLEADARSLSEINNALRDELRAEKKARAAEARSLNVRNNALRDELLVEKKARAAEARLLTLIINKGVNMIKGDAAKRDYFVDMLELWGGQLLFPGGEGSCGAFLEALRQWQGPSALVVVKFLKTDIYADDKWANQLAELLPPTLLVLDLQLLSSDIDGPGLTAIVENLPPTLLELVLVFGVNSQNRLHEGLDVLSQMLPPALMRLQVSVHSYTRHRHDRGPALSKLRAAAQARGILNCDIPENWM